MEARQPGPVANETPLLRVLWSGRELPLAEGENVLGRTHEAAVCVDHGSVSRRHAVIRVASGVATLETAAARTGRS